MADRATATRKRAAQRRDRGIAPARLRVVRPPTRPPQKSPAAVARTNVILLLVPAALLTTIGVVEVFSASSVYAFTHYDNSFWFLERQAIYAGIGVGALLLTARIPYAAWRRLSGPFLLLSTVLLLVALHPSSGLSAYGASRWIVLGPLTLQPSEFAKLGLIAFAATVLAQKEGKLDDWLHLALPLGPIVLLVAGIVMLQRDLGTTMVMVCSVLTMLFVAGARLRHLAVTGIVRPRWARLSHLRNGLPACAVPVLLGSVAGPVAQRIPADPGADRARVRRVVRRRPRRQPAEVGVPAERPYRLHLRRPGEELGLIGELVVLVLFGIMVYAGIRIAVRAPDMFSRLLAAGITSWIGLQAIVNLGAVTGLLPITGVPLPFVSFGGSALIVTLGAMGVLASIARAGAASGKRKAGLSRAPTRGSFA